MELSQEEVTKLLIRSVDSLKKKVGFRLLTFMKYNADDNSACRIFSTDEEHYPVGGFKPIPDNQWTTHVVTNKKDFIANNIEAIREVFFDYKVIQSLGLSAVINVPILSCGELIGIVCLLDVTDSYSEISSRKIKKMAPDLAQLFRAM